MQIFIGKEYFGKRIDIAIAEKSGIPRSQIQKLIKSGNILTNNKIIRDTSTIVQEITNIHITNINNPQQQEVIYPENIPLQILYEDDYIIVINKNSGMVCHPAPGNPNRTLVNALLYHSNNSIKNVGDIMRPGLVHRLDKDTSGLMVIAKTNEIHSTLSQYFNTGKGELVIRKYKCFVLGIPKIRNSRIETHIIRDPKNRQKYVTSNNNGKQSITLYNVLKTTYITSTKPISLIECELLTGRTHQIRVHMQHIGCNIIGDPIYGKKRIEYTYPEIIKNFPRTALHSYFFKIFHPIKKEFITFETDIPNDMQDLLAIF